MILVNFAHPITETQRDAIQQRTGQALERVIDVKAQFDPMQPFSEQVERLLATTPLTSAEWQSLPLLVNLPSLNTITALVLSELHGRMGYFPSVMRLRPVPDTVPPQFEVAEILNLQALRDSARERR